MLALTKLVRTSLAAANRTRQGRLALCSRRERRATAVRRDLSVRRRCGAIRRRPETAGRPGSSSPPSCSSPPGPSPSCAGGLGCAVTFSIVRIKLRTRTRNHEACARADEQHRRRSRGKPRADPRAARKLTSAREAGADLVLFPELAVTGYPPEDLLLRPAFIRAARRVVEELAAQTDGTTALVGAPHLDADLYNAAYLLADGEIKAIYPQALPSPNYGVSEQNRYFFASGGDLHSSSATARSWSGQERSARTSGSPSPARHRPRARQGRSSSSTSPGLAVPASARTASARRCCASRPATTPASSPSATWSGPRTRLVFDGNSLVLDDEGGSSSPGRPASRRSCSSSTSTLLSTVGHRLRDVRRRPLARRRRTVEPTAEVLLPPPRPQAHPLHPSPARPVDDDLEQMRSARARAGCATTSRQGNFAEVVVAVSSAGSTRR